MTGDYEVEHLPNARLAAIRHLEAEGMGQSAEDVRALVREVERLERELAETKEGWRQSRSRRCPGC